MSFHGTDLIVDATFFFSVLFSFSRSLVQAPCTVYHGCLSSHLCHSTSDHLCYVTDLLARSQLQSSTFGLLDVRPSWMMTHESWLSMTRSHLKPCLTQHIVCIICYYLFVKCLMRWESVVIHMNWLNTSVRKQIVVMLLALSMSMCRPSLFVCICFNFHGM